MESLPLAATGFLILFARVGAVLMLLPVFSEEAVPPKIRLMLALGMTSGLWGILGARMAPIAQDGAALPGILIAELLTGLAIGMIVKMMFMAAAMAGSIISLQVGLSSALINDASQGGQTSVLSKLVGVAATIVCMGMGVHHLWIASIVHSYAIFPVGGLPPAADFAQLAIATVGKSLSLAISLAAPLLVYGIVFNMALGLSARLAPAIQVFFLSQPLNREDRIAASAIVAADGYGLGAQRLPPAESPAAPFVARTVEDVERDLILRTLSHCRGNRTTASTTAKS